MSIHTPSESSGSQALCSSVIAAEQPPAPAPTAPLIKAEVTVLQAAEVQAQTLLAHRPTLKQVEKLGAVQFAIGGILGVHYFDGIKVVPERKRLLTKVLTLLICFSAAINHKPIATSSHSPAITNRQ